MRARLTGLGASCVAAGLALAVVLAVVAAFGYSPGATARGFATAAFGSRERLSAILLVACPLTLTGLGVCVAFRCGIWNIGAEGQYLVGALAAVWMGLSVGGWPGWLAVSATLGVSVCAGGAWAGLAAWLKLSRGVQEVLSTILLNFVAAQLVAMAVNGPLADPGGADRDTTAYIAEAARLPEWGKGAGVHAGMFIAVTAAVAAWVLLSHMTAGLRIRFVGANPVAARWAGWRVEHHAAGAFVLGGALAGLAGGVELAGNSHYLTARYGSEYGYTAIAVAMLARLSPLGVVPAAMFFATLDVGIRGLQSVDVAGLAGFPTALTYVGQGAVVLMVALLSGPPPRTGET